MSGSYLYDKVLTLIDYCGDVRSGKTKYNTYYSPNNIRRLYICPDGAMVRYHINAKTGLEKRVSFPPNKFQETQMCQDYKPMLHALSADRVCASVEEVVVCSESTSGVSLDTRELDFQGLVKSYKGGNNGNIKATISNRYKRLVAFIVFNGTLNEFVARTKDYNGSTKLLVDCEWVRQTCNIEGFTYKDWYKRWGSAGKFYELDRDDSPLNKHFKSIVEKKKSEEESEKIDTFQKERVATVSKEFDKKFEQSLQLIRGYTRLRMLSEKVGINSTLCIKIPSEEYLELESCTAIPKKTPNLVKVKESKSSDKDAIERNIQVCKDYNSMFYTKLVGMMLDGLTQVHSNYPVLGVTFLREFDRAIMIPPNLESVNSALPYSFTGARWLDSVANMFTVFSIVFLNDNNLQSKERWIECIK